MKQRSINPILPGGIGGAFIAPEHEQALLPILICNIWHLKALGKCKIWSHGFFCYVESPLTYSHILPHFFTYDFPQFRIYFSANLCKIWHEENLGPHHESEINLAIDHRIPFKATKFQLSSFLQYMNYSKKDSSGRRFRPPCSG